MVAKHGAGCSGDTCGDRQLHAFIGDILQGTPANYQAALSQALQARGGKKPEVEGMQLEEKIDLLKQNNKETLASAPFFVSIIVLGMSLILVGGFVRGSRNKPR
jgi:hypothetical protein